jgi:hypothetical protein
MLPCATENANEGMVERGSSIRTALHHMPKHMHFGAVCHTKRAFIFHGVDFARISNPITRRIEVYPTNGDGYMPGRLWVSLHYDMPT